MINKVNNQHDILTLVMPTNEPNTFFSHVGPTFEYMKDVAPITTIACNFQTPWTQELVDKAVSMMEEHGFTVKYQLRDKYYVESRGKVPFNRIRHDTAMLNPGSMFYGLMDDDFRFRGPTEKVPKTAGQQYLDSIDYLMRFEKCGFVLMGGVMFKAIPRNHIGPVDINTCFITGHGFVFRNMSPFFNVYPESALDLVGAGEEKLIAASRMGYGMYPAKFGCARTIHKADAADETYGWLQEEIFESNINQYLRDHYNPDIRGVFNYNVISSEEYKKCGGLNINEIKGECTVSYEDADYTQILEQIIRNGVEK